MNACFQYPEIPLRIWCLDTLGLQPATYGLVVTAAGIPWACKPLIGALVDVNKRRKLGVLVAAITTLVPWILVASGSINSALAAGACITMSSTGLCFMDITCDAILVTYVRGESEGALGTLQSNCWIARAAGAVIAAVFGGAMGVYADKVGITHVLGITGLLAIPGAVALYVEASETAAQGLSEICTKLKRVAYTLKSPALLKPCLFIFLLCAIPNCGNTLSAFLKTELHFTAMQFAIVDVTGHLAHGLGAAFYKHKLRQVPYKKVFKWGIIIGIVLQSMLLLMITRVSSNAGVPDLAFAILEAISGAIVGQVLIMPICVIAATRCPGGVEGTLYSAVMAITNLGSIVGMSTGSAITEAMGVTKSDYTHMWTVSVMCVGVSVVPLLVLNWIDVKPHEDKPVVEVEMTPTPLGIASDVCAAGGACDGFVDEPLSDADGTE